MLTGQYQRSLDSKIRVTLPATQRKELGDSVVLIRRENALHGYSPEACKDNTFFWFGKHYANFYGVFDAFIVVQGQKIAFSCV